MASEQKKANWKSTLLMPVFMPAVALILILVALTVANPDQAGEIFSSSLAYVTRNFGWFYMLSVAIFLVFIVLVATSKWGNIKLGPDHAEPQYSFLSWFAMLFSAGYGIALLFFGVAEPVLHYAMPPQGAAETIDAAKQAMQITFFHWGFHIWAIYGLVGLVLAYFAFRHGLPLSMRSALFPLIGKRIHGPVGHTVDVVAILGTMFGVATSLGLSVMQINTGLNYLWPSIPINNTVQVIAIAAITGIALFSVVAGLDKGVKNLSLLNMVLATALMMFVFVLGPTLFILETFLENTGAYLNNIIERTFNLQAYSRSDWIGNWTLFIFGWTIAWSPFVGLFIAKISRGRTIRQFVFGVMLVPTTFTFFWFSVFGETALFAIMNEGYVSLIADVQDNNAIALFKLLERLPLTAIVSFVTVILIVTFFVTSSDSASLVIDSLAAGGIANTPAIQRAFWATAEGVVAAVLLLAGGLHALQSMTIVSALPFSVILLVAAVGMWRALAIETHRDKSLEQQRQQRPAASSSTAWKKRLAGIVDYPDQNQVQSYITEDVLSAMKRLAQGLDEQGWPAKVTVESDPCRAYLEVEVHKTDQLDFLYEVRLRAYEMPVFASPSSDAPEAAERTSGSAASSEETASHYYRAEVFLQRGGVDQDVYGYTQQELIADILDHFERYLNFLQISPGVLPWKMAEHDDMLQEKANDTATANS
ncbi:MAG TPA: BCCT family transporter [Pusillimonas sp.]|uniref:BCCT family transporter n=1 Tax=unclassified Pusillimonas TaxID=2640016 RepID=UPI002603268D|nr:MULTISPECIES: BCCT family transporter [unclassified Pusillimonas]HLU19796.1 BCCT family transporter [Pusillimonas sp.]